MGNSVINKEMFPILTEVKETLEERARMYGAPEDSFDKISKMWGAYKGVEFSRNDVVIMMILLKVAREAFQHKRDNFIDIIGYAAHAGNFAKASENDESTQFKEAFAEAVQEETVNMDEPDTEAADHASDSAKFIEDMLKKAHEEANRQRPRPNRYGEPIWIAPRRDYPIPPTSTLSAQDSRVIGDMVDALFEGLLDQHK